MPRRNKKNIVVDDLSDFDLDLKKKKDNIELSRINKVDDIEELKGDEDPGDVLDAGDVFNENNEGGEDDDDKNMENSEEDEGENENLEDRFDEERNNEGEKKEEYTEYDEDNKCFYKHAEEDSDQETEMELTFDDDNIQETKDIVPKDQRITKPILFKFERVRLLGDRIQQLTLGAKPMIKNAENFSPKEIALLELKNNVIPLIIERPLPNGKKERWMTSELIH